MEPAPTYIIAAFYKFLDLADRDLLILRDDIRRRMEGRGIVGTVILANEGVNSTICGLEAEIDRFVGELPDFLAFDIEPKYSYSAAAPFRKIDVKIKLEIV